jgi:hypothetical protein
MPGWPTVNRPNWRNAGPWSKTDISEAQLAYGERRITVQAGFGGPSGADDWKESAGPSTPGQPGFPGQQDWQMPPMGQMPDMGHGPPGSRPPRRRLRRRHSWVAFIGFVAVLAAIRAIPAALSSQDSGGSGNQSSGTTTAALGSVITLAGIADGEQVTVTAVRVINSATSSDSLFAPTAGERYYAVQFRLDNTGSVGYAQNADFEATVIDSAGKSFTPDLLDTASGCPGFPATGKISPGSSLTGCVVFDLPTAAAVKDIRYVPDSGQGPQTGQWTVGD